MAIDMAARTTQASTGQEHLHTARSEPSKRWFGRQLLRPMPWQAKGIGEKFDRTREPSLDRPRTAPSAKTATVEAIPPVPPLPTEILSTRHGCTVSYQSSRLESGVVRDVNAWLDASSKPASPLMGGVLYWRDGPSSSAVGGQYAVPIVKKPERQPSTSSSRPLKSFCRRAKKMQVRMPSLKRGDSVRSTVQKKINRRSPSMPLLGPRYEYMQEGPQPVVLTQYGSILNPSSRSATASSSWPGHIGETGCFSPGPIPDDPLRRGSPASASVRAAKSHMGRQVDISLGQRTNGVYGLRSVSSTIQIAREDSTGSLNLSDAPTYFTGPPPPSYRSRAASILTTSSFGCIDGMTPEQRQLSQQKAQRRRGMKGKLKKFVQKARFTK
jgi:hypothetical protein